MILSKKRCLLTAMLMCFLFAGVTFAQEADTLGAALKDGNFSGMIGSYYEFSNLEAENSDYGWSSAYLTFKYETLSWKNLKIGGRFWAHGKLYSGDDDGTTSPYNRDIETPFTLPEMYLNYSFLEDSSVTLGRFYHKKVTHLDDNQSEGAYLNFKEIDNLDLVVGVMYRFAEIDYDDSEDFGRNNNAQDLDNKTLYGDDSRPYVMFLEGKSKFGEILRFNPYLYYQSGYAGVFGFDVNLDMESENLGLKYGSKLTYYHVAAENDSRTHADAFSVFPYVKSGPIALTLGYEQFSSGNALNKPLWFADYMSFLDQQVQYAAPGSQKVFAKLKYSKGKFWTHAAYGGNNYDFASIRGDRSVEYEMQFGYKFTENCEVNLRLFDVQYDNVDNRDYNKVETCMYFKF